MLVGSKTPKRNRNSLVLITEESKAHQRSWSMDIYIAFLCMPLCSSIQKAQRERDTMCIRTGESLSNWRVPWNIIGAKQKNLAVSLQLNTVVYSIKMCRQNGAAIFQKFRHCRNSLKEEMPIEGISYTWEITVCCCFSFFYIYIFIFIFCVSEIQLGRYQNC